MPAQVVVVLNDTDLADLAAEALNILGFEAIAFHDSMEALQALESASRVDLLVTSSDFQGGGPNGLSLARMTRLRLPDLKALFIGPADIVNIVSRDGRYLATPTTAKQIALAAVEMLNSGAPFRREQSRF